MLDSSKFSFEPYHDVRTIYSPGFTSGLSGPLLIGINQDTGEKFLIKHTYPHNAANEYVACWLAGKIKVPTPKAYLLSPNKAFRTPYAVAIEYINGLRAFPKDAVPEELKPDLIGQFALCFILQLEDVIQMSRTDDHIYSYDFSEGFQIENLRDVLQIKDFDAMTDSLMSNHWRFKHRAENEAFNVSRLAREFHLDPNEMRNGMLAVLKRTLSITESDINEMSDELGKMYPIPIAVLYEERIRTIIEEAKRLTH